MEKQYFVRLFALTNFKCHILLIFSLNIQTAYQDDRFNKEIYLKTHQKIIPLS